MNKAVERKETIEQLQTEVEQLTDTIAADQSIVKNSGHKFRKSQEGIIYLSARKLLSLQDLIKEVIEPISLRRIADY